MPAFVLMIMLAVAVLMLANVVVAASLNERGVNAVLMPLVVVFSGSLVPLDFFPDAVRPFLHAQPLAGLVDIPVPDLLRRPPRRCRPAGPGPAGGMDRGVDRPRTPRHGAHDAPPRDAGRLTHERLSPSTAATSAPRLRAQAQYPAATLMLTAGHLAATAIEILGLYALFHRFGQVEGWSFGEVALFYGLINISFLDRRPAEPRLRRVRLGLRADRCVRPRVAETASRPRCS